ncbi:MAG: acireductone dioxygenase, partial [Pirellulaceae bacterium]
MAKITVPDENREITDVEEIREFLAPFGIWYEKWEVEGRIGPEATNDEILDAYSDEIERLKAKGGFVTADVINVTPETPGLDAMCAKFADEHTHSEDEVRFTVKGRGVFHVNPANGPVSNGPVSNGPVSNGP